MKTFSYLSITFATLFIIACNSNDSKKEALKSTEDTDMSLESPVLNEESTKSEGPVNDRSESNQDNKAKADSVSTVTYPDGANAITSNIAGKAFSSKAAFGNSDTSKKFIRTADLRFRVKDAVDATLTIEDIAAKYDGYITNTDLQNQVTDTRTEALGEDSTIEISKNTLVNNIELRVPNKSLDSLVRAIGKVVDKFDYRKIQAQDITINLWADAKRAAREKKKSGRVATAVDKQRNNLNDITYAEGAILDGEANADAAQEDYLRMMNDVQYSKVVVSIYELPKVSTTKTISMAAANKYKPGFLTKLSYSLEYTWNILLDIVVLIISLWYVILLSILAYILYKRYGKKGVKTMAVN